MATNKQLQTDKQPHCR